METPTTTGAVGVLTLQTVQFKLADNNCVSFPNSGEKKFLLHTIFIYTIAPARVALGSIALPGNHESGRGDLLCTIEVRDVASGDKQRHVRISSQR